MKLLQSSQDYLETILILSEKLGNKVRTIDIANDLNVTKQSVHRAITKLKENGYVEKNDDYYITLTKEGLIVAEEMLERHILLTDFFVYLGVSQTVASEDACKVEHYISKETFNKIKEYFNNTIK